MSLKRKAVDDDNDEMNTRTAKKVATAIHPFFATPTPSTSTQPFQWLKPVGEPGTCLHGLHMQPRLSTKLAAFDLDGTIITPKSGNKFSKDHQDWKFWNAKVVPKLIEAHKQGYAIVFISNQAIPGSIKSPEKRKQYVEEWKKKLPLIATGLTNVPFRVMAATGRDFYRKPMPGMWFALESILREGGVTIDKKASIFVGDAAGRQGDHAITDRQWAENVGIPFLTPEEYFLGYAAQPYIPKGFHPSSLPNDVPLLSPTSTPMISKKQPEIVLFVGYPSMGKTTFYRKNFLPAGYVHVNQDTLKTKAKCLKAVKESISKGTSCVVDNTNRDRKTRQDYLDLATELGVAIRCFYFKGSLELAYHNNLYRAFCLPAAQRIAEGNRTLLDFAAYTSFKEALEEPAANEGFQEIRYVNWRFEGDESARMMYNMWLKV